MKRLLPIVGLLACTVSVIAALTYSDPVKSMGTSGGVNYYHVNWESGTTGGSGSGGIVTNYTEGTTNWTLHVFTTVGSTNFVVSDDALVCDVLIVAGGGAGGGHPFALAGGGGAGGVAYTSTWSLAVGTHNVTVGQGGTGVYSYVAGTDGGDSSFNSLTAEGGGGGGHSSVGRNGGSGGGGSAYWDGGPFAGGSGVSGQGHAGGHGYADDSGGGGGAGEAGQDGDTELSYTGGNGGDGTNAYSAMLIAANLGEDISGVHWIGGGGGGGDDSSSYPAGLGGKGGGGDGTGEPFTPGSSAMANTGGGGGGGAREQDVGGFPPVFEYEPSGAGGSGLVIVRYQTP